MKRVLLVETASPKRVRQAAEKILSGEVYGTVQVTILCRNEPQSLQYLGDLPGVEVVQLVKLREARILRDLRRRGFDIAYVFWTGERLYRRLKLQALRLGARAVDINIGDDHVFRFALGSLLRFWFIRRRYPLPSDHSQFALPLEQSLPITQRPGERILIIQSAEPEHVRRCLERLTERPLFQDPIYTLFCRNRAEVLELFGNHPLVYEVRAHSETRDAWFHLRELRREHYDGVIVFYTGDPSYWKIKFVPFLLGVRHKLVFNENGDCFFFSWRIGFSLLNRRLAERWRLGAPPSWMRRARTPLLLMIKVLAFPFRFVWLLLVWVRLRSCGLRG